jgi:TorA maturation chaperone TorD
MGRTDITLLERNADLLPGLHFLCRFFWGPDLRHCREMVRGVFSKAFSPARSIFPTLAQTAVDAFNTYLETRPDADALCRDLQVVYARLFLSGRSAAGAPLYQSCYLFDDAPLMGPPALRMKDRLESVGLSIAGQGNEPPDHLAAELEYLYFVLARARENEAPEMAADAAEFAETELCSWLHLFADRLARISDAEPYNHAAVLTRDVARLIAEGRPVLEVL